MSTQISIKQLPKVTEIDSDDLILVQTPNSTNSLQFSNFVIGLDNTTFGATITQNTADIKTLSAVSRDTSEIDTLSANVNTLSSYFSDGVLLSSHGGTGRNFNEVVTAYVSADQVSDETCVITDLVADLDTASCLGDGCYTVKCPGLFKIDAVFTPHSTTTDVAISIMCNSTAIALLSSRSGNAAYPGIATTNIIQSFDAGDVIKFQGAVGSCANDKVCGDVRSNRSPSRVTIMSIPT